MVRGQAPHPGSRSASDLWPAAATMCSMRGRCRMHDVGISFAYLGDARNNVGTSVGVEI
jgi:hypothetical protein